MLLRAIMLAACLAQPASAFCLLGCDATISQPAAAKAAFETTLGQPLAAGVTVQRILKGGFQDKFIQVLITADYHSAAALMSLLHVDAPFETAIDPAQLGPAQPDWWTPQAGFKMTGGPGTIPGYAETMVGIRILPGTADHVTIYIFAFQT